MTQITLALLTHMLNSYTDPLLPSGFARAEGSVLAETVLSSEIQVDGKSRIGRWIEKVTDLTLTGCLPGEENRSGIALLIRLGGGFSGLDFDKEETQIVCWPLDQISGV